MFSDAIDSLFISAMFVKRITTGLYLNDHWWWHASTQDVFFKQSNRLLKLYSCHGRKFITYICAQKANRLCLWCDDVMPVHNLPFPYRVLNMNSFSAVSQKCVNHSKCVEEIQHCVSVLETFSCTVVVSHLSARWAAAARLTLTGGMWSILAVKASELRDEISHPKVLFGS